MGRSKKKKAAAPSSRRPGYLPGVLAVFGLLIIAAAIALRRPKPQVPTDAPTLAEQVLAKARPLVSKQQYGQAIALMSAYVQEHPDDVEVRPLLAESQLKDGDFARAERTIDQVVLRAPRMARALWLKGLLLERRGEDAAEVFREAAESPDASGDIWASYAVRLLEAGQAEPARGYLTRARSAGITDARTLGPLGQLALQEGELDRAERLLTEALETAPRNGRIQAMLAEAQIKAGKTGLAADTLAEAACDPACKPELLLRAAMVHCEVGRIETAKAYLARASELLGENPRCEEVAKSIAEGEAAASGVR